MFFCSPAGNQIVDQIAGELRRSPRHLIVGRALVDHRGDLRQFLRRHDVAPLLDSALFRGVLALQLFELLTPQEQLLLDVVGPKTVQRIERVAQ